MLLVVALNLILNDVIILIAPKSIALLTNGRACAMALFPFILLKSGEQSNNRLLLNHERIHIRQQLEMCVLFFFILYFFEYLVNRIKGLNHYESYRNISFEREAYTHESNENYLNIRPFWNFRKYF